MDIKVKCPAKQAACIPTEKAVIYTALIYRDIAILVLAETPKVWSLKPEAKLGRTGIGRIWKVDVWCWNCQFLGVLVNFFGAERLVNHGEPSEFQTRTNFA